MICWCGNPALQTESLRYICQDSTYHDPTATGRPDQVKVLYLAGPMSNMPKNNYPAFNKAARRLRDVGFTVVNPAEFGSEGGHYVDLIREDLRLLLDCHAVAVLPMWWESTGARNEVQVAGLLKMPVQSVRDWIVAAREGTLVMADSHTETEENGNGN